MRHSFCGMSHFRYHEIRKAGTIMTLLLAIIAALCGMYYILIVIYSGFATSFSAVWLFLSAFFCLLSIGHEVCRRYPKKIPLWISVSAVTFCLAGAVVFIVVEFLIFVGVAAQSPANLDYVIVLGAKVREDTISSSLKKRLDKAIEYSQLNPKTLLVLSGGQGPGEPMAESQAMYDYLVFNGIPEERLIQEDYSASTVENIAYSRVLIEENERGKARDKPLEIGVLTSNYHVFRAQQIAKKWGIPGIRGIASESDPVLFVHFCVRECAAILKDKLMGNM